MSEATKSLDSGPVDRIEHPPWRRPTLRRLNSSLASQGGPGVSDHGKNAMS
jgi:hypothetical protein